MSFSPREHSLYRVCGYPPPSLPLKGGGEDKGTWRAPPRSASTGQPCPWRDDDRTVRVAGSSITHRIMGLPLPVPAFASQLAEAAGRLPQPVRAILWMLVACLLFAI